jgi:hypothetical protein
VVDVLGAAQHERRAAGEAELGDVAGVVAADQGPVDREAVEERLARDPDAAQLRRPAVFRSSIK